MNIIKPGNFGKDVPADRKRAEFDYQNEQILYLGKKVDLLFIGDSITHHCLFDAYLDTDKFIVNRGIGGDNSTYLLKRFDADCVQLKPEKAILMIGTNDIFRCEYDAWWKIKGEDEDIVFNDYKENVIAMIRKCDDNNIDIILCSVIPSFIAPPFDREMRWRMTQRFNDFLKSTGKMYIDFSTVLSDDGKIMKEELSPDGIHPNAEAYKKMIEYFKTKIDI